MHSSSKLYWLLLLLCITAFDANAQIATIYDSTLAKKVGANDNGMKQYVLVILTTGPANITDKTTHDSLFAGHMSNINDLANQQKLVMAGPLGKNNLAYRGIFILNTNNIEDAKTMVATDPAVKAGIFNAEYFEWFGSASLMLNNELHKKLQKPSL